MTHSYRKFLACPLHAEKKLMAQKLCLVKEKGMSNESNASGWKYLLLHVEVGPWFGRVLHRTWARQSLHRALLCASVSLNLSPFI